MNFMDWPLLDYTFSALNDGLPMYSFNKTEADFSPRRLCFLLISLIYSNMQTVNETFKN